MNSLEIITATFFVFAPNITGIEGNKETSIECLALNLYHEARGQGSAGLLGVSSVVLNRVKDKRFPNTICEVIYQGPTRESWKTKKIKILPAEERKYYPVKNRCQFSWYCDGKSDTPKEKKTYKRLLTIARSIVYNKINFIDITDGATFYHANYVRPAWAKVKTRTTRIGDHIFYRWETGQNGSPKK
jgi:spore germination cell wall hydrolase CwlJ-like protein